MNSQTQQIVTGVNQEQNNVAVSRVASAKLVSGSFLRGEQHGEDVLTPEHQGEEHKRIASLAREFVKAEVIAIADRIEQRNPNLTRQLIQKACKAGIGNVDITKKYGGPGGGIGASIAVATELCGPESFSASFLAHVTGALPIVYFGTAEQKQKYLPKLASGEWTAAFALSESESGSDARSVSTSGTLSEDGAAWILNGEKSWVTNGGFADVFIVFAKLNGDQFSSLIVDKSCSGLRIEEQKEKMTLRGAATYSLILNNCQVPRENVLGMIGRGERVAFNTLNVARLKLGAASISSAHNSLKNAATHAKQRKAFGRSLAEFGCIKEKIAFMAAGIYCGEAMLYRVMGAMESAFAEIDESSPEAGELFAKVVEECAAECSILKVWGSELFQYAADETLQIFGGAGFVAEHPAERSYRNARAGRICAGTNEINRLIIAVWIAKRAMSGALRIGYLLKKVTDEVMTGPKHTALPEGTMATERELVENARKATLMVAGVIWQKFGMALVDQQEMITALADMLIENYAMDCVVRRTQKLDGHHAGVALAMARLGLDHSLEKIESSARKVIAALVQDEMLDKYLLMMRHLFSHKPFNTIALCRQIAHYVFENGQTL